MNDQALKLQSLFQPCVTIDDDGNVDIDWGDSYVHTVSEEMVEVLETDPHKHADALDEILGFPTEYTPANRLRLLAAHIELKGLRRGVSDS